MKTFQNDQRFLFQWNFRLHPMSIVSAAALLWDAKSWQKWCIQLRINGGGVNASEGARVMRMVGLNGFVRGSCDAAGSVRWCRWMRNHRQPLLHQENILLGCTHSARAGCKVNCALEAVQSFNSSAMFQQQCNVSTAVQCFNSSVGWQWMRNQAAFKANNSPVNNSSQTLFRGF